MHEPVCPLCKVDIECIDTIDSYEDISTVKYLCIGQCPVCGKEYQWLEVYEFSHIKDLEENH